MKTVEVLPSFRTLWSEYGRTRGGFDRAYREWCEAHRAAEKVYVPAWDRTEFLEVYREVERRCELAGLRFEGRPGNDDCYVTPTGGRLFVDTLVDPLLGPPAPVDPPTDLLLRLSWRVHYWRAAVKESVVRFAELKQKLVERAFRDSRDEAALEELRRLHEVASQRKRTLRRIEKKREPLLPAALRPRSPEEAKVMEGVEKARRAYDSALDSLEL